MIRRLAGLLRRHLLGILLVGGLALLAAGLLDVRLSIGGGRYVEAVLGPPVRVNPLARHLNDAENDLAALVFSGLMRIEADGRPVPDLASSWESTPDALTYTFHLRRGVAWHDGVAVTARDVAFTIARIQAAGFDGAPALAAAWSDVQVSVEDPFTVLIRTPEPQADLLARAAVGILPAHLAAQMTASSRFDVAPFDRRPVGTGPYRLRSMDDRRAVLQANPRFALGAPRIATIELRFVRDADAQLAALRGSDVDAALLGEQPLAGELATLQRRRDLTATALTRSGYLALYVNNQRPPLDDLALRRALIASIDRALVLAAGGARAMPAAGVIPPASWLAPAPPAAATPRLDSSRLEALWGEAGWRRGADGRRVRGSVPLALELATNVDPGREAMARSVTAQLGAQGIEVTVVTMPASRLIADRLQAGNYQLALFGWDAPADPDPYPGWHSSQAGGQGGNVTGFRDAEVDALIEAARTTLDVAERREIYARFATRFADRAPALILGHPARAYVHPRRLQGAAFGLLVTPGSRFSDVFRWRLH